MTAEPMCWFAEGCHRVVACDPGCGVPAEPVESERDRLHRQLAACRAEADGWAEALANADRLYSQHLAELRARSSAVADLPVWAQRCSCGGQGLIHLSAERHEPIGPADVDPFAGRACELCGEYVTGPCPTCAPAAIAAIARVEAECDRIEAAVRANPTNPDFDGTYLTALKPIRRALSGEEEA